MNKATGRDLEPLEWEPTSIPGLEKIESNDAYAWLQFRNAWFEWQAKELSQLGLVR